MGAGLLICMPLISMSKQGENWCHMADLPSMKFPPHVYPFYPWIITVLPLSWFLTRTNCDLFLVKANKQFQQRAAQDNLPMDLCFSEHCMMKRLFVYYSNRQGVASKQRDISVISHSVAASCKRAWKIKNASVPYTASHRKTTCTYTWLDRGCNDIHSTRGLNT